MQKKKIVTLDAGEDPLSGGAPLVVKKNTNKNAFERMMREQERDLLGGDLAAEKKTSFVVNKSMQVNLPTNKATSSNTESSNSTKFPFASRSDKNDAPTANMTTSTVKSDLFQQKPQFEENSKVAKNPFSNFMGLKPSEPKSYDAPKAGYKESERTPFVQKKAPAMKLETVNLAFEDTIPGEKLACTINCLMYLMQYPKLTAEGTFIISNYKIFFKPNDENFLKVNGLKEDYLRVPLGFIYKFEKSNDKKNLDVTYFDLYSKDGRIFKLKIAERFYEEAHKLSQYLHAFVFPDKKEHLFAFEHGKFYKILEEKFKGWKIYDIESEFARQGVDFEPFPENSSSSKTHHTFRFVDNRNFKVCSTYPPKLLIPAKISDQNFLASSRFRTKERVPCVTYYYAKTKAVLSRSSQSKPGIYQTRSLEDEQLLRYLGNPHHDDSFEQAVPQVNLHIFDARPYLNAVANRVNGKGFEDTKCYKNCEIFFMDIDNIHHVREGHRKLLNLCYSPDAANNKWYSQLESTNWLEFISYIIGAACKVSSYLRKGQNCLVHCSDGWDRTAQILSLAQIMLDPYFRTIEGFEVLVMKDWVYFGHQFNLRLGHGNKNEKDDQKSPVFLQFLDCVHQLMIQYPFAFEFNQKFLSDLAYQIHSCRFGLFLCNSYQEITLYNIEEKTICVWSYLNSQKELYENVYYKAEDMVLRPSYHLKSLRLWEEFFLYYSWLSKPNYHLSDNVVFQKDFYDHMFIKEKKKADDLKSENEKLRARLAKYEAVDTLSEGSERNQEEEDVFQENPDSPLKTEQDNFQCSSDLIFKQHTKPSTEPGKDRSYEEIVTIDQEQVQEHEQE